jgi:tetratricopeptide (TPR) repeat protein
LDQATAAAFRRAALIPGADFDAALMAAAADTDATRAARAAEELADAGLLISRGDRYQFHDLVRLYARERLDCDDPPDLRGAARDRVTGWLLHRTEQAGKMFEPDAAPAGPVFADHEAAAGWLDRESGNWPAALRDAARQGRHDEVIRVARALHWYSDATSHRHAWEEIFSLGVTAAQAAGRPRDEAALLNFLGWARFYTRDRNEDGLAALGRALTLAQQIGDRREEAWALTYTASIYVRTDRAEQAVEPARQAAELFAGMGYRLGESAAVNMWGVALAKLGRFAEAVRAHRSVLDFYRTETGLSSTGALIAQASTLMHLGGALGGWGRWRAAANAYDRAGRLFQRCGAAFGEATAAYRHGLALCSLARDDDASAQLRQARLLFAGIPSPWWEAQTLHALAELADRAAVAGVTGRRLREQALDRCVDLDAPEAVALRDTLLRELAG